MKLLSTKVFGDPKKWEPNTEMIATHAWSAAEEEAGEPLLAINLTNKRGIMIDGDDLIEDDFSLGYYFTVAVIELIDQGVFIKDYGIRLYLSRDFIEAQQRAHEVIQKRTYRLADLCIKAIDKMVEHTNTKDSGTVNLGTLLTLSAGTLAKQHYIRASDLTFKWSDAGLVDRLKWSHLVVDHIESYNQPAMQTNP